MAAISWAQRQRLNYIARQVDAAGKVFRSDLNREFGVSLPTASTDFARFLDVYPGALKCESPREGYVPGHRYDEWKLEWMAAGWFDQAVAS